MNREDVYFLIDEEREYQDTLGPERVDGHQHSVAEELLLLQAYVQDAANAWVGMPGDSFVLDEMPKIAAIAVRCLENYGSFKNRRG